MEERKTIKISISTMFLIIAIIVIAIMGYCIYTMSNSINTLEKENQELSNSEINNSETDNKVESSKTEEDTNVQNEKTPNDVVEEKMNVLEEIHIPQEFYIGNNRGVKEVVNYCDDVKAVVKNNGKLEITLTNRQQNGTHIVEGISGEIIDIKFGLVEQINSSEVFVRDIFVLTKNGDVYSVFVAYGYNADLVKKIETNVVKIENVRMFYNTNGTTAVVAKKSDGSFVICDDGIREGGL